MRSRADEPRNSGLIMLDGLPGTGKSMTGQWLAAHLQQRGIHAHWLPEAHVPHPLWWYDYWNGKEYLVPDFDRTPIETYFQTSLKRWKEFTSSPELSEQLVVAESFFFQNTSAMFLMGGAHPNRLLEYAREVQQVTYPLQPSLIYLSHADSAAALRRICELRGLEFQDELIRNMESFPYLKHGDLKGLEGVSVLWQDIQTLTDSLFEEFPHPKLDIETSDGNWPAYRQLILEFLGLP